MGRWENTVQRIKDNEGFRGLPYEDSLGNHTIGHGLKLPLTREESEMLMRHRFKQKEKTLRQKIDSQIWNKLNKNRKGVLLEMAYNMGVGSLMEFKQMFDGLRIGDYTSASNEMLNSEWKQQVGERAVKLAYIMEKGTDVNVEETKEYYEKNVEETNEST